MGRHLDKLRRLDKLTAKFQKTIVELNKISKEGVKPDKKLALFTFGYALLNYQFAIYLITIFPKAVEADKIDREFTKIMKDFDRRNGKKKRRKRRKKK